jgi:hypothetical protein
MAAKIGILDEDTGTSAATVDVYTVGTDKAARVKIQFAVTNQTGANRDYAILIGTPGTEAQFVFRIPTDSIQFTGFDIASGEVIGGDADILRASYAAGDLTLATTDRLWQMVPFDKEFYLSAGDTVRYISSGTLGDHLIQVIGVEDDA